MRSRTSTGTFQKRKIATKEDEENSRRRISNSGDEAIPEGDSKLTVNLKKRIKRTEDAVQADVSSSSPRFLRPRLLSVEDEQTTNNSSLNSSLNNSNNNLAGELHTGCTQQLNSMNFENSTSNPRNLSQTSDFHLTTLFGIPEDNRPEIPNSEYFEHFETEDFAISPNTTFPTRASSNNNSNPQVSTPIARSDNNISSEIATSTIRSIFNADQQEEAPLYLSHQDSGFDMDHSNAQPHLDYLGLFDIAFHLSEYKNVGHLGSGGSSIVYKAVPPTNHDLTELTAIKKFENPQETDSTVLRKKRESNRTQALNEVRILTYLNSSTHGYCPYVMRAIRHDQSETHDYIELELMDDSLDKLMSADQLLKEKLLASNYYNKEKVENSTSFGCRLDLLMHWTSQIVEGLAHCHNNNIIHRDIKTQNILVLYKENLIKIADFGLSCFKTPERLTDIVGTTGYFAPEMWFTQQFVAGNKGLEGYAKIVPSVNSDTMTIQELEKERNAVAEKLALFGKSLDSYIGYNEKIDIWALGCVIFQLASGRSLYTNENFSEMVFNENLNFHNHDCKYTLNKAISMLPEYLKDDVLYEPFVDFLGLCLVHCPDDRADVNELMIHDFIYDVMGSSEESAPIP